MVDAPIARMPPAIEENYCGAMSDWQGSLGNRMNFAEMHLVLGGVALTMRNLRAAAGAFLQVTLLDPQRADAWVMRVRIAEVAEGPEAASAMLAQALAAVRDDHTLLQALSEQSSLRLTKRPPSGRFQAQLADAPYGRPPPVVPASQRGSAGAHCPPWS
jgi:hypothetical protein